MALDAVGFPLDIFNYACKDSHPFTACFSTGFSGVDDEVSDFLYPIGKEEAVAAMDVHSGHQLDASLHSTVHCNATSLSENCVGPVGYAPKAAAEAAGNARGKKRRRSRGYKNMEEVENQRMTHIAVERNRRKQMNEYLAVLRSLMPPSYSQRGDQASIVGGAINFVKELEHLVQSLEAQKRMKQKESGGTPPSLADLPTFQKHSCTLLGPSRCSVTSEPVAENRSGVADVEVALVESHASLKILSRSRPRQLLKLVAGFQSLRLAVLHLNVTSIEEMVLYSVSAKVRAFLPLSCPCAPSSSMKSFHGVGFFNLV
ncbi:Transcription factor [Nymphaea thermarum]|nr:Transcription factor [Nymphaea thermarum]